MGAENDMKIGSGVNLDPYLMLRLKREENANNSGVSNFFATLNSIFTANVQLPGTQGSAGSCASEVFSTND